MQLSKNSSFKEGSPWLATTVNARATINRSSSAASDHALRLSYSDKARAVVLDPREPAKPVATNFRIVLAPLVGASYGTSMARMFAAETKRINRRSAH